jgi:hypothetical protein
MGVQQKYSQLLQIKDQKLSSSVAHVLHLQDGTLLLNVHICPIPLSQLHLVPTLGTKLDAGAGRLPLVITTRLDNVHIGLFPLQRPAERLARPKDRRVKSQLALYRGRTLALPGILTPSAHTGATTLAHLSVFSSSVKWRVTKLEVSSRLRLASFKPERDYMR